jgi:ABC-type transport system involved in cytochrome c biogenesis permease subunit
MDQEVENSRWGWWFSSIWEKEVLLVTAAYAAVLVVFVGTCSP